MRRRQILSMVAAGAAVVGLSASSATSLPEVEVFKSPYCQCCGAWVDHIKTTGFAVKVTLVNDTTAARKRLGMPDKFGSCRTATVDGYVLEAHVPAAEVKKLLAAKPAAVGLAVPGMPPGSPGMEVGTRQDPYKVFLFDKSRREAVFASYPKA